MRIYLSEIFWMHHSWQAIFTPLYLTRRTSSFCNLVILYSSSTMMFMITGTTLGNPLVSHQSRCINGCISILRLTLSSKGFGKVQPCWDTKYIFDCSSMIGWTPGTFFGAKVSIYQATDVRCVIRTVKKLLFIYSRIAHLHFSVAI